MNSSIQLGIVQIYKKITTDFFSFITCFDIATEEYIKQDQGTLFDLQQNRCQANISEYVRDVLKMDLCADSLFELC